MAVAAWSRSRAWQAANSVNCIETSALLLALQWAHVQQGLPLLSLEKTCRLCVQIAECAHHSVCTSQCVHIAVCAHRSVQTLLVLPGTRCGSG